MAGATATGTSGENVTFTMPAGNVTATIHWTDAGSSGGGDSSGSSDKPAVITPPATSEQPKPPANAQTKVDGKAAVDQLIAEGVKEFKIESGIISFSFNSDALKEMQKSVTGSLTITAKKRDVKSLSAAAQTALGNRPVFDLSMQSGGKVITGFGKGAASVWMPYTLQKNELVGNVLLYWQKSSA